MKYTPDSRLDLPAHQAMSILLREGWNMRWQIWVGFKKGFKASYEGSVLGILWALILPLIPVGVYVLLAQIKVMKTTDEMPFVIYITVGMVLYLFMTGTMIAIIDSVSKEKGILKKVKYPIIVVMCSNFGQVVFDLCIRIVFLVPIVLFYEINFSIISMVAFFIFAIAFIMFFSLGMIASLLNIIYKDVRNILDIIIKYGLFFSSVLFALPSDGIVGFINRFNPFNTFVVTIRDALIIGRLPNNYDLLLWLFISLFLFFVACKLTYAMENRIKEFL